MTCTELAYDALIPVAENDLTFYRLAPDAGAIAEEAVQHLVEEGVLIPIGRNLYEWPVDETDYTVDREQAAASKRRM